jgi:hypothetical protein
MILESFEADVPANSFPYAVLSECESKMVVLDPAQDTDAYIKFAHIHRAKIIAIVETHFQATSGALKLHQETSAPIYVFGDLAPEYAYTPFGSDVELAFGKIKLQSTAAGILLLHEGEPKGVFTGTAPFGGKLG